MRFLWTLARWNFKRVRNILARRSSCFWRPCWMDLWSAVSSIWRWLRFPKLQMPPWISRQQKTRHWLLWFWRPDQWSSFVTRQQICYQKGIWTMMTWLIPTASWLWAGFQKWRSLWSLRSWKTFWAWSCVIWWKRLATTRGKLLLPPVTNTTQGVRTSGGWISMKRPWIAWWRPQRIPFASAMVWQWKIPLLHLRRLAALAQGTGPAL